jgi:hypothetical protein
MEQTLLHNDKIKNREIRADNAASHRLAATLSIAPPITPEARGAWKLPCCYSLQFVGSYNLTKNTFICHIAPAANRIKTSQLENCTMNLCASRSELGPEWELPASWGIPACHSLPWSWTHTPWIPAKTFQIMIINDLHNY